MKYFLFLIILLSPSASKSQTTITLQPGPTDGKDTKVFNLSSMQNFGSDLDIIAATWTFGGEPGTLRSMIQFDLTSIPPGATILDARLSLFYNFVTSSEGQAGNNAAYLRRITQDWNENTVNWITQPSYTNTNQVDLPKSTSTDQDYENINVTLLVRDMLSDPSHSFGFMFMGQVEAVLSSMKFFSSDASQESDRPKLEITYTTEPAQCLTLQPGSDGKDAKVFSLSPADNFGNDLDFIAASWTFGGNVGLLRSFIEFDFSAIPQNAQIISAALSLYYNVETSSAGQSGSNSAVLQRVVDSWNEQSINWNNQPSTTSNNEVILPMSSTMNQDYPDIDVTNLVTDMISNPGSSHGFMLKQLTEEVFRSMKFSSSDVTDPTKHPKLEICYQLPSANKEIKVNQINVIPNPFQHFFIMHGLEGSFFITLTDLNGRIYFSREINSSENNIEIDNLEYLPAGFYIVNAYNQTIHYFGKVIKI